MPELKPYYGVQDVPKGSYRASMKEAVNNNQIRFWGLMKFDPKLLEMIKVKKISENDRERYIKKLIQLKAKLKKLTEKINNKKTKNIPELIKQKKKLKEEGVMIGEKLKEINKILKK